MSERSARQRQYLSTQRVIVQKQMRHVLESDDWDLEDSATLYEVEFCKALAGAMFLGGEFGAAGNAMSLEQFVVDARTNGEALETAQERIIELEHTVNRLTRANEEMSQRLGGKL